MIDRGHSVIYRTMFDMLYPYCWYHENAKGIHDNHYGAIVDYDEEYYYFIDSPYVLNDERTIKYNENNTINLITHENMRLAFDKLCELSILIIKEDLLDTLYPIDELINKIRINYFKSKIKINSNLTDYTGKPAYLKLLEDLKSSDFNHF